ncbi:unnamed protein product, partial [Prorocentrum cordatum]
SRFGRQVQVAFFSSRTRATSCKLNSLGSVPTWQPLGMTRRRQRREGGSAGGHGERDNEARSERIVVFEKTKMCKFHIMGICTKGDGCRFAHERTQLQTLPDLSCTKLCKTL